MSKKILIADDDKTLLQIISFRIKSWGYEPITVDNAKDALEKVKSENPDLLIFDYKLADESGVELLEQVRKINKDTPAFILTAYPSSKAMHKSQDAHATKFILKLHDGASLANSLQANIEECLGAP